MKIERCSFDRLPHRPGDILGAINDARTAGPPAIAQLAILCLWQAGQQANPLESYPGPAGTKPLEHLALTLEGGVLRVIEEESGDVLASVPNTNHFFTYTTHLPTREYPKPHDPRERAGTVAREVAASWVEAALNEMNALRARGHQWSFCRRAILHLWQRGARVDDLQPLIAKYIDPKSFDGVFTSAWDLTYKTEVLARVGRWGEAIELIEALPLTQDRAASAYLTTAKWFMATGRPDLARPMLEKSADRRDRLTELDLAQLAEVWVYLGEEPLGRELHPNLQDVWRRTAWESVVALSKYYHHGATDPAALLALLEGTRATEPPKARAGRQYAILDPLLAIEAEDAVRQTLAYLQDSLLACPVWGKREHRTDGAVQVLLPYLDTYPDLIHDFAAGLMTGTAGHVGDFWNIVFVVSGLRWLIHRWAGTAGIRQIVDTVRAWQTSLD
ncbi:MAG: hypothetical protein JXB47_05710 [Anaerolineae bacterium]|nr:hypothetical protein [Anaerolineae bacterium]